MPKYLMSALWAPGQVPVVDDEFEWKTTTEQKWYYGNIGSTTKVMTLSRLGGPISMIQWQLKRNNCRLASPTLASEGSLRQLCELCNKYQSLTPKVTPHLDLQGCSVCLNKLNFIDVSLLVS